MAENERIKCGHCNKVIETGSYVEIAVDGKRASRFCNTECWDKFLKGRLKEVRNPEQFIKGLKEKQKKYRKEMIKKVRAKENISTDEEIVYFYEGLSNKKKGALARRLFSGYVRHADGNVKEILNLIDTGRMSNEP